METMKGQRVNYEIENRKGGGLQMGWDFSQDNPGIRFSKVSRKLNRSKSLSLPCLR